MIGTALAVATILAVAPKAPPEVVGTIQRFVDGFNHGDVKSAVATCASPVSVVDEFPPYAWQGATACQDWANDFDSMAKQAGITDGQVKLGAPRHVDVAGDRAYAVVPATYRFKEKGKPRTQSGALITLALQKLPEGWRITAWAWSHGTTR